MKKSEMMECITKGFEAYEKFVGKELVYIYKKDSVYKEIAFKAKKTDFMHLCGIHYIDPGSKSRVSAGHFYSLLKSQKISPDFLVEKSDGTTELKLKIIKYLGDILGGNIRIVDDQIVFQKSFFESAIRSRKMIFALGLYREKGNLRFGPQSLINLKTDKDNSFKKSYEVHKIYSQDKGDQFEVFFESEEYKEVRMKKQPSF